MDADEQKRVRDAMERLRATLTQIVATGEEKSRERCGYRARDSRCTFAGGCMNKRGTMCGGDEFIRFAPRPAGNSTQRRGERGGMN